jgi:regulatory protein
MSDALRDRALRLLARREHCRSELCEKLLAQAEGGEVDALLDQLEASGLLSDRRFAESYVAARRGRYGMLRLRRALHGKGVAHALIDEVLAAESGDDLALARQLWQRKFPAPPNDAREYARQARFLQSRGFAGDLVRRILRDRGE